MAAHCPLASLLTPEKKPLPQPAVTYQARRSRIDASPVRRIAPTIVPTHATNAPRYTDLKCQSPRCLAPTPRSTSSTPWPHHPSSSKPSILRYLLQCGPFYCKQDPNLIRMSPLAFPPPSMLTEAQNDDYLSFKNSRLHRRHTLSEQHLPHLSRLRGPSTRPPPQLPRAPRRSDRCLLRFDRPYQHQRASR